MLHKQGLDLEKIYSDFCEPSGKNCEKKFESEHSSLNEHSDRIPNPRDNKIYAT